MRATLGSWDTDLVASQNAALFNSLLRPLPGPPLFFVNEGDDTVIYRVETCEGGTTGRPDDGGTAAAEDRDCEGVASPIPGPHLIKVTTLPAPAPDHPHPTASSLHPTVVAIRDKASGEDALLLASTGRGDLTLVDPTAGSATAPVHPIRPVPPGVGCAPFQLLAAARLEGGVVRALAWSRESGEAGRKRVAVWTIDLAVDEGGRSDEGAPDRAPTLVVLAVSSLWHASAPPFAAVSDATTGRFLVASAADDRAVDREGREATAAASGRAGRDGGEPARRDGGSAPAGPDAPAPVSPDSLARAVERLEAFTEDNPADGVPLGGCVTDVFGEMGEDDAPGDFPGVVLDELSPDATAGLSDLLGGATSPAPGSIATPPALEPPPPLRHVGSVPLLPHRSLAVAGAADPARALSLLVTDDVDAVPVEVTLAGPGAETLDTRQTSAIPAFAYVASGKVGRRFVLAACGQAPPAAHPRASFSPAAAIVERTKLATVYGAAPAGATTAAHVLLPLEPPDDEVVGASLEADGSLLVLTATRLHRFFFC